MYWIDFESFLEVCGMVCNFFLNLEGEVDGFVLSGCIFW